MGQLGQFSQLHHGDLSLWTQTQLSPLFSNLAQLIKSKLHGQSFKLHGLYGQIFKIHKMFRFVLGMQRPWVIEFVVVGFFYLWIFMIIGFFGGGGVFIAEILLRWWQNFSGVICGFGMWVVAGLLASGYGWIDYGFDMDSGWILSLLFLSLWVWLNWHGREKKNEGFFSSFSKACIVGWLFWV